MKSHRPSFKNINTTFFLHSSNFFKPTQKPFNSSSLKSSILLPNSPFWSVQGERWTKKRPCSSTMTCHWTQLGSFHVPMSDSSQKLKVVVGSNNGGNLFLLGTQVWGCGGGLRDTWWQHTHSGCGEGWLPSKPQLSSVSSPHLLPTPSLSRSVCLSL